MQSATLNQESKTVASREGRPLPPRLSVPADESLKWCWDILGWRFLCLKDKKPTKAGRSGKSIKEVTPLEEVLTHLSNGRNVGILTGSHSGGLFVVDYDQGSEFPDPLPKTVISRTGGSGLHVYYQMPKGTLFPNSAGLLAPKIDTRGEGGYVVSPPSLHSTGARYEWIEGHAPWDCDLQELPFEMAVVLSRTAKCSLPQDIQELVLTTTDQARSAQFEGLTDLYLKRELRSAAAAVLGAAPGTRNDTLNKAAFTLGGLAQSGLTQAEACSELLEAASAAGLPTDEAMATFDSGWTSGTLKARLLDAHNVVASDDLSALSQSQLKRRVFPRDDVRLYAEGLLAERFTKEGKLHMHRWRGEWWEWGGTRYLRKTEEAMRGIVCEYISCRVAYLNSKSVITHVKPTVGATNDLLQGLISIRNVLVEEPEAGRWLDDASPPSDSPLLPVENGLLEVLTRTLYRHTPSYLNTYALGYKYEAEAPEPVSWLAFLDSLWGDDQESIDTLQEWFGYVLSGETGFQKILFLIGPKRSGKGTIARVLTELLGAENVCNPTFDNLGSNFGLQIFLDKSLAIFGDARVSSRSELPAAVERMLSISGEDSQTVDRKYREPLTIRLPSRLMIVSNELPRINDSSGAFASRLLTIQTRKSYLGNEDHQLFQRLRDELPGILHWGLDGLSRLKQRGKFTVPASAESMVETFLDLSSPISAFVREHCVLEPTASVRTTELYTLWTGWCRQNGIENVGSTQNFARELYASFPEVVKDRSSVGGSRIRYYKGIRVEK